LSARASCGVVKGRVEVGAVMDTVAGAATAAATAGAAVALMPLAVTVHHMDPTLGEPDFPEICTTTAYFKLFRWRPPLGLLSPPSGPLLKGLILCKPDLDYRLMLLRAPDPGAPRGCHVAPFLRLYSMRCSKLWPYSGLWAQLAMRGGFSKCPLRASEEGFPRVL